MKKLFLIFCYVLVFCLFFGLSYGFLIDDITCPIDNKSISGIVNEERFTSQIINCDEANDPSTCYQEINLFLEHGDYFEVISVDFFCNDTGIFIDGIRCFYDYNKNKVFCPLIDESRTTIFSINNNYYFYPEDTPILPLTISTTTLF